MDGFAVRSIDCQAPVTLRITGCIFAGALPTNGVEAGCAVKIMTGAPLPQGCDAVIPLEAAEEKSGQIRIQRAICAGENIRRAGEDVRRGEVILPSGTQVRPAVISMLASCSRERVAIFRRPKVAILSTGDELVELNQDVTQGKVIDSNGIALAAAVQQCGGIPISLGIARDTRDSHMEKISAAQGADVLIVSAGVSVGLRDFVREVLSELGMTQVFRRIEMSPASPTCFGLLDGRPVFCLPGNPVASLIAFELIVKPALLKIMGHVRVLPEFVPAVLEHEVKKKAGKVQIFRVKLKFLNGQYQASSAGNQNTGILSTMLKADGLAILPAERILISPGESVPVHLLAGGHLPF
jgi:molybdopterin molybdotransferase